MARQLLVGDAYNTVFDPLVYLANYVGDITGHEDQGHFMKFCMDAHHKAFSQGNYQIRKPALGGCRYRDANPVPTNPLVDDIAIRPSGPV